jgi:hypothetical protein
MEWKKAGANAELHMYGDDKGPYELMPETGETTTETWSTQLIQWLKAKGLIKELTFANMAGIYDDEKQESRFCLKRPVRTISA